MLGAYASASCSRMSEALMHGRTDVRTHVEPSLPTAINLTSSTRATKADSSSR